MHQTVQDFVRRALTPAMIEGKRVLEVGSYNVNGSVRPFITSLKPALYVGVDTQMGPGVDRTVDCERLTDDTGFSAWDLVVSTEMLEHVEGWRRCFAELANALAPRGLLLITTRSPGFPYHPYPVDNWRYTKDQMREILTALHLEVIMLESDPEPGVFVLARRPYACRGHRSDNTGFSCAKPQVLRGIEVDRVIR